MTASTHIEDGTGAKHRVKVTPRGQLVTAPYDFDIVSNAAVIAANTAYNLYKPKAGFRFVITAILITAKKDVTTDEIVDIYETEDETSTTITKSIIQIEMLKNSNRDFIGLNLISTEGAFISVKSDDATTLVTMMGYYIKA